jgi:hypothetical protein
VAWKDRWSSNKEEREGPPRSAQSGSSALAPHLFLPLVTHFLEQFHNHKDDSVLCKRAHAMHLSL